PSLPSPAPAGSCRYYVAGALDAQCGGSTTRRLSLLVVLGGADRDRTDDLLNAIQALSQLSYSPTLWEGTPPTSPGSFAAAHRKDSASSSTRPRIAAGRSRG